MNEIKLFGKWDTSEVKIPSKGLERYVALKPTFVPHSSGRVSGQQFIKSKMNIVERLVNKMMKSGQGRKKIAGKFIRGRGNTGKKQKALNIVDSAFDIIAERTKKNPVQVFVDAIANTGPQEETTTIIYGGIRYHQAVDSSTQRRVDFGLKYIAQGAFHNSFKNSKPVEQALADEIIWASKSDTNSYAIQRKEETERIAKSSR
ncbi:MAG: 30S ribosomal protein S7 [Candidatus Altiarchaeales archaeon]|nr:30S ribosomal protein S7 [Candidatus Altiarchaeales archaeon]